MIQALHGRCVMGSVRDPHSHRVVEAVGVHNAILTGCPVLFWTREPALPTIPPAKRRRIVLTARNWLMHRWPDSVDHPVQIRFLGKLLESFPGDQIVFAVHEEYDARLVDHLDIPRRMVFWSKRPEDYVDLYTDQGSVILAMRLHAGMLGVANGVPALFVAHDTRTYSFTQMMDIDCVGLFEEGSAEQCIIRLRRLLDGDVEPLRKMTEAYQSLHAAMMKFLVVNGLPVRASAQGGHAAPSTSEHHRRD